MSEPTEFQCRVMGMVLKGPNKHMSITEIAARLHSNRLAVRSAVRSLERNGWAVTFRSDSSQWAVLMVAPTNAWLARESS